MDQQYPTVAKIPVLDTGKFEQWQFRIQQYLQHKHYALWEVIKFGDSYVVPVSSSSTTTTDTTSGESGMKSGRTVTLIAEDMQKKKKNVKARTTLLLSLPDEYQLRFSKYKTARELWAAILKTFSGNEATKKTKKNLLKQQYGNFKAEGSETLNRNEDGNTACVSTASTNVPTASANIATISQDTACAYIASQCSSSQIKFEDINQIDEDDMEKMDIKWNIALLSMRADKFWKKTWKKISIQGSDVAGFDKSKVDCFNYHKMGHFARECRAPRNQDRGRSDNYKQASKVEEQAPNAFMAIDGVGWDWSYMANNEEDHALVADEVALTEFALMANTSVASKVFDNSLCSKDCKKNNDSLNSKITDLTDKLFDANNLIYHYKLALAQVESRLVEYKKREVKYYEKIRTLEFINESNNECIEILKKKLETLKLKKDRVDGKLVGLLKASKDLDNLIESQRPLPTVKSTSGDDQNRNPSVSETVASPITPKPFIKLVKPKDSQSKSKTGKTKSPKKPPVKKRVQKSFTPKPVIHRPYRPSERPVRTNMNGARLNRTSFNKQAHSYANRPFLKTLAVRSHYKAPWVPTVNRSFPPVNRKFSTGSRNFPTANRKFPTASRKFSTGSTKFSTADMGMKGKAGSSQNNIDDKGYWDSGCSRHMTGNISYLYDFEPFDEGYVSFGQGGCKITGKGTIKTGKLEFKNVYFVKDLKYNLFSVSQICDNKNSVLFTDSECIVLERDFKLLDDANILLRTPRQHNMYSIDLNNIVPHRDLTCLVAKASANEYILWHRRLEEDQNRNPSVSENVASPITPKPFIKFVKPKDSQSKSKTDKRETSKKPPVKYAEQYRKPNKKPNVRGNQRNWNNLKSHQLGLDFVMKKKACFNCGDFNHLAYDCQKRVRKSFTPKPVTHRPYKPSQRPVRTNMNGASLNKTSFNKQAHSYGNRPFHRTSVVRSPYRPPWVPTANRYFPPVNRKFSTGSRNFPTTNRKFSTASRKFPTGSTKSLTADMGMKGKAGNFQNKIDYKGDWNNGCSRHMTCNISYLFDYEPFDGGYVSFGQGGCKITGKGTIKTGKLKFENVYFVKDLKYNLFSVSHINDNKNSVLFTDSECIVLERDFKLLDDANILLRTLRQHNIGLPTKCFENDHTCTACLKGKQHKASCKSRLVNSVTKPLHTLHMDLFGPTSDEASGILKKFITEIENLKDLKVKIIRTQQNGVAEKRNRTLIEVARTMLADAKLLVTFWAEAVNITCYVQNRVLVNKSHNKTPYKLFNGRSSAIGFLKPFVCHVMILNTLDHLGKFKEKWDEGYFIGYSMSSKAFRVFNNRTRRVEENLHVKFLENKAIEKGAGPNWLFDIDSLTKSMNYVPVDAGIIFTNFSGTKDTASQKVTKDVSYLRYIALPNWAHDALLEFTSSKSQDHCSTEVPEGSGNTNPTASTPNPPADHMETLTVETPIPTVSSPVPTAYSTDSQDSSRDARLISKRVANQEETPSLDNILSLTNRFEDILGVTSNSNESNGVEADISNMETTITTSPTPTLRIHKDHPKSQIIGPVDTPIQSKNKSKEVGEQSFIATIHQKTDLALLQFCLFSCFLSQVEPKKISDALQDPSWVEAMQEELFQFKIQNVWTLVDCPKGEEGINYDEVFAPVARIKAIRLFLAYASFMGFTFYQMDVKSAFLYGTIDEEVYVMQPPGFQDLEFPAKVYKVEKSMSSNTPMDKENPWGKDGTGKDVDLHLYRSMIGSLMYL
nr:hypothetical protein [Tanacetum cinerariifolium]